MKYQIAYHRISMGWLGIKYIKDELVGIEYIASHEAFLSAKLPQSIATPLTLKATQQIQEYLDGVRSCFDVPICFMGTPFQQKVWKMLLQIPYGTTCSYKYIAESIGCPKGCRAVGMAVHCNPFPFIVPCHRVVKADGGLGGYAYGSALKRKLLELEKLTITSPFRTIHSKGTLN